MKLEGWEAELFGIVVSVEEAEVVLSVRENRLVFSLVTQWSLETTDTTRQFARLQKAVESAKHPSTHYRSVLLTALLAMCAHGRNSGT